MRYLEKIINIFLWNNLQICSNDHYNNCLQKIANDMDRKSNANRNDIKII